MAEVKVEINGVTWILNTEVPRNVQVCNDGEIKTPFRINRNLKIGDAFKILGLEWTILDVTEKGYVCLSEKLEEIRKFDSARNDWKDSNLRNYLNTEFYNMLAAEIGAENIIPFERDLLSMDGQTEYGTCEDKVSLINVDEYRKYRKNIPNSGYFFWTLTPDSTKCNKDTALVRVISLSGNFGSRSYDCSLGVRPFCIFSSNIFV